MISVPDKKHDYVSQSFFIFLNSGGVIVDAPRIPLNNLFLNLLNKVDKYLNKFPKIFPLQMYTCLTKR